jgi:hypothetical protein
MMSVRVCFLLFVSALTMAQSNSVPRIKQPLAAQMPLSFEVNRGQTDVPAQFLSRGRAIASAASPSGLNFAPAVAYDSGGQITWSVAVADVNGDGKPDLVVTNECVNANNCDGTVGVLLGNGDGTFQAAVTYDTGYPLATSVAVADVNGDGKPDIVVADLCVNSICNADGAVSVLLGNGDGTFQRAVTYDSGGNYVYSVAVADVNGDGTPDIVVSNRFCSSGSCNGDGFVGVLLGNGDGTFQTAVTYDSGGNYASHVAVADLNGDGKPDIVVVNGCGSISNNDCGTTNSTVGVLLGNGDGTFQTAVSYGSGGVPAWSVAVADVNGDGKPDIVVANTCSSWNCPGDGSVGVLLGNGDGTFQTAVTYDSGGDYPTGVAVADVNGDGKPDIVAANGFCCSISTGDGFAAVLLGNGDGTFQAAVTYDSGGKGAWSAAVADVNGDGRPDIVVANECSSSGCAGDASVSVLINTGTSIDSTTTALVSSPDPSNFAHSVTFTATVTAKPGFYKGPPPGTVRFLDGTILLGSSTLNSSGVAALTISKLLAGTHSITATYKGDTNFAPSTSPVLSQTVRGAVAKLSACSVSFGKETVGMTSAAKSLTLTNKGNIDLTIESVGIAGTDSADFVASKCPASIAPNGTCTISVTFKPTGAGTRTAELSITDSAPSKVQKASLTGVGVLPE